MDAIQESLYWLSSTIAQTVTIGFAVLAFFIQTALQKRADIIKDNFEFGAPKEEYPHRKGLRKYLRGARIGLNSYDEDALENVHEAIENAENLKAWIDYLQRLANKPAEPEKLLNKWEDEYYTTYQSIVEAMSNYDDSHCNDAASNVKQFAESIAAVKPRWITYFELKSATKDTAYKAGRTILAALIAVAASFVLTDSWPHMSSTPRAYYSVCSIAFLAMPLLIYLTWQCLEKFVDLIVKSLEHLP